MPETQFHNFNAVTVALEGSNLIEASAGTGKTYSIAILVLRLLLEKKISVKDILMVTFTRAAVAELEDRIRLFVRMARKASLGEEIKDKTIEMLVKQAAADGGIQEVQSLMQEASLFLDETSVLTIHGFCQLTLTEFAFETSQLFGSETLQDGAALLTDEVNKFWRKYITTIPLGLLEELIEAGLTRGDIAQVIKDHLDGKKYFGYKEREDYSLCEQDYDDYIVSISRLKQQEEELRECLDQYITDNVVLLTAAAEKNSYARKNTLHLIADPRKLSDYVWENREKGYIQKIYDSLLSRCEECEEVQKERRRILKRVADRLFCLAINIVAAGVAEHKQRNNQMSFDDMIVNLHNALVKKDNQRLTEGLRKKYKAVFVDEFQDTDRLQYEIFQKAFGQETILFYIGDPKQSIYAWRKADIFTYFKAYDAVEHKYGMNTNYRSSSAFIKAMNLFFKPLPDFDTFYFGGATHSIEYIPVEASERGKQRLLYNDTEEEVPLSICEVKNRDAVIQAATARVADLLGNPAYRFCLAGKEKQITPGDIGILVRSNREGRDMKAALARYRIPAVMIGDEKILQSAESAFLLYLLEAMETSSLSNINRALLSPFTGYSAQDILALDEEKVLERFGRYKAVWEESGVYAALTGFITDFSVRRVLLGPHTENGERIITNLFQLLEILHKIQVRRKLSPQELISWLKRGIEGMETEGDEYEQRVESDEDAIKIVTIHKSKGLEYNIVIAPFLDFMPDKNRAFCSFRDAETGEYVSAARESLDEEHLSLLEQQQEQENRRLLYVAVTRAVYKCFIFKNTYFGQSTLSVFMNALHLPAWPYIEFSDPLDIPEGYFYKKNMEERERDAPRVIKFDLLEKNWRRISYSMLAAPHVISLNFAGNPQSDLYDRFIFYDLPRGAKTGNLLHFIFENIRFENSNGWGYIIDEAIRRFVPGKTEMYSEMLHALLDHVLHVPVVISGSSFCLSDVSSSKQLHEFEFDFRVPLFDPLELERQLDANTPVRINNPGSIEGLMNGKMDLFFEWGGKFFILDWKSNFLGYSVNDYTPDAVAAAMNENNYHLQYLLYTVAAKKYLESRLPSFNYESDFGGVIYFFVRGVRRDLQNGIFTCKPSAEQIIRLERILKREEQSFSEAEMSGF